MSKRKTEDDDREKERGDEKREVLSEDFDFLSREKEDFMQRDA